MVIGAVTKGSQRFKRTYEMVKRLECFRRFRVRKGTRTFRKRFRSLPKYLWSFRVRKGVGNSEAVLKWHFQNETSEAPEPLCGSRLNTVTWAMSGGLSSSLTSFVPSPIPVDASKSTLFARASPPGPCALNLLGADDTH